MRKFKRFRRDVGVFVPSAVDRFELKVEVRLPVSEFSLLCVERVGLDLLVQPEIQQPVLLLPDRSKLPLELLPTLYCLFLVFASLGSKHPVEPIADFFVFDPYSGEQREDLTVKVCLGEPDSRVPGLAVLGTPIVNILPFSGLGLLCLRLTGNLPATMPTGNQTGLY